jgi:hypothetical protein
LCRTRKKTELGNEEGERWTENAKAKSAEEASCSMTRPPGSSFINYRSSLLLACLACALCAAGCGVVGALTYKLHGPLPVEAQYVPPPTPMLVMVEQPPNQSEGYGDAEALAMMISKALAAKNVAPQVDPVKAIDLRSSKPLEFGKLSISEVGKRVGAEQVLYVRIDQVNVRVAQGSDLFKGSSQVRARVVDVATGTVAWPPEAMDGLPVGATTEVMSGRDGATAQSIRTTVLAKTADSVAKLFYKWKPEE